jgi:hypothetical protein
MPGGILQRNGMTGSKVKSTPMEQNLKLCKGGDDQMESEGRYGETVGALFYLTTCTRPDMAFAVGVLARFISKPREEHWACVKGFLRYLKHTMDFGIKYGSRDATVRGYILPYDSPRPRSGPEMEPGLFTHICSHTDWMLMALKFLETALTQLSDDILHSSVYHVLHWS